VSEQDRNETDATEGGAPQPTDAQADTPGASMLRSFEADAVRLRGESLTQDDLAAAFGYWIGYPSFLEWIICAPWPDQVKRRGRDALDAAHHAATHALMHEAGRRGLDPHPLYECGRVVEEVYRQDPNKLYQRGTYDTWPERMGSWRYDLPAGQQDAIRAGEAVFIRLAVALDIEVENTEGGEDGRESGRVSHEVRAELTRMMENNEICPSVTQYREHHHSKFGRKPSRSTVSVVLQSPCFIEWRDRAVHAKDYAAQGARDGDVALARLLQEAGPEVRGKVNALADEPRRRLANRCGRLDKANKAAKGQDADAVLKGLLNE